MSAPSSWSPLTPLPVGITAAQRERLNQSFSHDPTAVCTACGGWLGRKNGMKPKCHVTECPGSRPPDAPKIAPELPQAVAAAPIAIPSLSHEAADDAVQSRAAQRTLPATGRRLALNQRGEVSNCARRNVPKEVEDDPSSGRSADGHVQIGTLRRQRRRV